MTFVPLNNLKQILQLAAGYTSATFTDTSGTSRAMVDPTSARKTGIPFYCTAGTVTAAPTDATKLFPVASSNSTISGNETTITNQVGTASATFSINSKGWICNIKITATEGSEINSIYFEKYIFSSSTSSYLAVLFAVRLDNTVTVDSTGEANFTFAIEYN